MTDNRSEWAQVGTAIRRRVDELKLSKAELERRSGVSYKTLQRYMDGEPIVRPDKARGLCDALGWTPDSIDRMLRGESPTTIEMRDLGTAQVEAIRRELAAKAAQHRDESTTPSWPINDGRLDQLAGQVSEAITMLDEIRTAVHGLSQAVQVVLRELDAERDAGAGRTGADASSSPRSARSR